MLCVIAKLDDASTEKLAAIREAAFSDGEALRPLHGHITVATYVGTDEDVFLRSCRKLLAETRPFAVTYTDIEVLGETAVLAAVPERSGPLDRLHRKIAERYPDALDPWTAGERWYPHTTLYYGPGSDLAGLCRKMRDVFRPFTATISRIEFSRVLEDGYRIVDFVTLPLDGSKKSGAFTEEKTTAQSPVFRLELRAVEPEDVGGNIGGCFGPVSWRRVVDIVTGREELVRLGALRIRCDGFTPDGKSLRLRADGLTAPKDWELGPDRPLRVSLTVPAGEDDAYDDDAAYTFTLLPPE